MGKKSIANVLDIESWRIVNLKCGNGSIITTFDLLPPDEGIHVNATAMLKKDIDTLASKVESGNFQVEIESDDGTKENISVVPDHPVINRDITEVSRTAKSEEDSDSSDLLPLYIVIGVIAGIGLLVFLFLAIKYK